MFQIKSCVHCTAADLIDYLPKKMASAQIWIEQHNYFRWWCAKAWKMMSGMIPNRLQAKFAAKSVANKMWCLMHWLSPALTGHASIFYLKIFLATCLCKQSSTVLQGCGSGDGRPVAAFLKKSFQWSEKTGVHTSQAVTVRPWQGDHCNSVPMNCAPALNHGPAGVTIYNICAEFSGSQKKRKAIAAAEQYYRSNQRPAQPGASTTPAGSQASILVLGVYSLKGKKIVLGVYSLEGKKIRV